MAKGLCKLCHGYGSLFCVQNGKFEWWDCPACGGRGYRREPFAIDTIKTHAR